MAKKPVKLILKFSNNSTPCDHKDTGKKSKPKKSASPRKSASNGNTSVKNSSGPRKLRP